MKVIKQIPRKIIVELTEHEANTLYLNLDPKGHYHSPAASDIQKVLREGLGYTPKPDIY